MNKSILVVNSNAMFEDENSDLFIYGGTAKLLIDLAETCAVTNFHFKETKTFSDTINNFNLSNTKVSCKYINKGNFKLFSYLIAYVYAIWLLLKSDCLYLFYPNSFKFLSFFCIIFRKPFGLYVRGQKDIHSKFSKIIYQHASFINTVSPHFTDLIKFHNTNVNTIKPMINYSLEDSYSQKLYNRHDSFNLLFVGRIEVDKGIFELIEAYHAIYSSFDFNINLTFVGDGSSLGQLKSYVDKFELNSCVQFAGSIFDAEDLKLVYLKSDILLLPTYHEGFPRVLYEAMIFSVPIITTFVGGIPSLMKDNDNCLQIVVKSKEDIFNKLLLVINDFYFAIKLANKANSDVREYLLKHNKTHLDLLQDSIIRL